MCFCQLKGYFRSSFLFLLPLPHLPPVIFSLRAAAVPLLQIISLLLRRGAILAVSFFPLPLLLTPPHLKGHPLFFFVSRREGGGGGGGEKCIFIHVKRCRLPDRFERDDRHPGTSVSDWRPRSFPSAGAEPASSRAALQDGVTTTGEGGRGLVEA